MHLCLVGLDGRAFWPSRSPSQRRPNSANKLLMRESVLCSDSEGRESCTLVPSTSGATPLKKCAPRAKPRCCLGRDHLFHRAAWGGCRNPRSKKAVSSAICQSRDVADQQAATPRSDPDTSSHDLAQNRIGGDAYLPTLVEPPDEIIDETRAHIRSDRFPHFPKRPRSYNRNTAISAKACNQGIDHPRLDRSRSHFASTKQHQTGYPSCLHRGDRGGSRSHQE